MLGGRYRILFPAGEKKSCVVFRGVRASDNAAVAVRVLAPFVRRQPHVVARLRSRAEFAMGMEHPNLVPVHELEDDGETFLIVESWFEALPLLRVVRGKGACSPYETAWIASRLARAVDHLILSGAPGFDFTLSDVYADIGDLKREQEFFSMPVHQWPGLEVRLSPLALDGDGFSERSLATPTDSAQPLVRSLARIVFNLVTGGMGDPLIEPVLSEKFTASLRDCLTGARQASSCRELLWTLFGDFGPEISELLPTETKTAVEGEVDTLLEDLDRQGEELEALLRYKTFGKQIKRQLAVLEEQRAGVFEQQRKMRDDGARLQELEMRLRTERDQLAGQRGELERRGSELAEKERQADEAARARAAELRERELELENLRAGQEQERSEVRAELERLRVSQEGLAREKKALSERVALYESEQQELATSRQALESERRKVDAERGEIEARVSEFKRLKSELDVSERDLEEKRRALSLRQSEMEAKGAGLSEVEREARDRLAAEQRELLEKIEALQAKGRALDAREEALRTREASLEGANQALAHEEQTLAGRLGEVDAKLALEKGRLTDKEREIESRERTLAVKEREWQDKLERQRDLQNEKEALLEELRGRLAGVTGELQAVTAEKQRLEAEQSRLKQTQDALGERSVSLDRERTDLKAFEEKLRKELQDESEARSRDSKALERKIVRYRRFVRFGAPAAALVILGLGALLFAKPKFPGSATDVQNLPEWKQEWLRRDLAQDIAGHVAAGEWREALGALHYYALGFSRRPDEVMDAARRTCAELAKEFEAGPDQFATTFRDHEGHEVPVAPALAELANWGLPDAARVSLQLTARESLRQATDERSLGARAQALRAIVELRRFYPDAATWKDAVSPVLMPLVASSIGEAMALLGPEQSGAELSKGYRGVFSSPQVIQDLKMLEESIGLREAAALRLAAEALAEMTKSGTPDTAALAIFVSDRLAEDWPVSIRASLVSVLMAHVDRFRQQLRKNWTSFVDALERSDEKPADVVKVAERLWEHLQGDYLMDWFGKNQRRELYCFVGDALTKHQDDKVMLHEAYQFAANEGAEVGIYWSGRGLVGSSLRDRGGNAQPPKEIANPADFEKGKYLLEEAAKSSDKQVKREALWVLAETALDLGDSASAVSAARQLFVAGGDLKSAEILLHALLARQRAAPQPADEIAPTVLEAIRLIHASPDDPRAEDVLDLSFKLSAAIFDTGVKPEAVLEEMRRQFEIGSRQDRFAGLRFWERANWKQRGRAPFDALTEDERHRQTLEDLWESAQAGYRIARDAAVKNGLTWQMDKETAVKGAMGE